jgi:hypothetical protein
MRKDSVLGTQQSGPGTQNSGFSTLHSATRLLALAGKRRIAVSPYRRLAISGYRLQVVLFLFATSLSAQAQLGPRDPNSVIVSLIQSMPIGGGYSATTAATRDLQAAVQTLGGKIVVDPFAARSTYCAGATYMIFVRALQTLLPDSAFSGNVAVAFAIRGQPDGVGVWGRWNANGPGTACLFKELGLGRNFTSFEDAQPGDFMKIFWSGAVGAREHGHSVIYLGRLQRNGMEMIRFWSSNQPNGYGEKIVPRSRIANAVFSRLEVPSNSIRAVTLPERNRYLASLLSRNSSFAEALAESGAEPSFASDRQSTPLRNP